MAEELGKVERPEAATFTGKRKLYVVPLLYRWPEAPKEYNVLFERYWQEIKGQLRHLEERIGAVNHVYHEGIDATGEAALKSLEQFNTPSFDITQDRLQSGASLTYIEDRELMAESLDWERFSMLGFTSPKVARIATESLMDVMKRRYDFIINRIAETLQPDQAGVLFIREGHPIQFPKEIEVFSVFPPSLNEIHRYLRDMTHPTGRPEEEEPVETAPEETESASEEASPPAH
ncbi:hypothetical protein ABFB09_05050 [Dehalogenimonas sp. THU2]|uniref:hypothetical protein n=1 Tax=Dehalogenimonas sp. THU2 TaxID=3151121 RepID=UPI003218D3AE